MEELLPWINMELGPFIFICMFALIFCLTIQKKTLWLNGEQQQRTGQIGWVEGAESTEEGIYHRWRGPWITPKKYQEAQWTRHVQWGMVHGVHCCTWLDQTFPLLARFIVFLWKASKHSCGHADDCELWGLENSITSFFGRHAKTVWQLAKSVCVCSAWECCQLFAGVCIGRAGGRAYFAGCQTNWNIPWLDQHWDHKRLFLCAVHRDVRDVRNPRVVHEGLQSSGYCFGSSKNTLVLQSYRIDGASAPRFSEDSKQSTHKNPNSKCKGPFFASVTRWPDWKCSVTAVSNGTATWDGASTGHKCSDNRNCIWTNAIQYKWFDESNQTIPQHQAKGSSTESRQCHGTQWNGNIATVRG